MEENNLKDIELFGELQFSKKQVYLMCEITEFSEIEEKSFLKGQLKAEAEVRNAILKMAKQGSTPAQKQFQDLVKLRKEEEKIGW